MASLYDDAQLHDELNFFAVSALTAWTLYFFAYRRVFRDGLEQRECFLNGFICTNPYTALSWATLLYTVLDTLFLLVKPACTKRLGSLLLHHAATIVAVCYAMHYRVDAVTAQYMLVEVSTFFLTIKNVRRITGGILPPRFHAVFRHRIVSAVVNSCFLISWVLLRLQYYPFLWVVTYHFFNDPDFGASLYYIQGALLMLVGLNFYWTAELVGPKVTLVLGATAIATVALRSL